VFPRCPASAIRCRIRVPGPPLLGFPFRALAPGWAREPSSLGLGRSPSPPTFTSGVYSREPAFAVPFGSTVPRVDSCSAFAVSHCLDGFLRLRVAGLLHPAAGRMFAAFCRLPQPGDCSPGRAGAASRRFHTPRRTLLVDSRSASPRSVPSCCFLPFRRSPEWGGLSASCSRFSRASRRRRPFGRWAVLGVGSRRALRALFRAGYLTSTRRCRRRWVRAPLGELPSTGLTARRLPPLAGGFDRAGMADPVHWGRSSSEAVRHALSRAPLPTLAALRWGRFKTVAPTLAETGSVRVRGSKGSGSRSGWSRVPPAGHVAPAGLAGSRDRRVSELTLQGPGSISTVHLRSQRPKLALRAARGSTLPSPAWWMLPAPLRRPVRLAPGRVGRGGWQVRGGARVVPARVGTTRSGSAWLAPGSSAILALASTLPRQSRGLEGHRSACADEVVPGWAPLGLVRWVPRQYGSRRLVSVPPGLPCAGAVGFLPTALSVGCGAPPLDPRTEGRVTAYGGWWPYVWNGSIPSRGRPNFKAFIRRRVWCIRTPVSGGGKHRFSHGLCFPFEALSSRRSSAAALGPSLPRFGHHPGRSVRTSGPRDPTPQPEGCGGGSASESVRDESCRHFLPAGAGGP